MATSAILFILICSSPAVFAQFATWAVRLVSPHHVDRVIEDVRGVRNNGRVGQLNNHFVFTCEESFNKKCREDNSDDTEEKLRSHGSVVWIERQVARTRVKRSLDFHDPLFPRQWHLLNHKHGKMDLNVSGVWAQNITGIGVTVVIVDDGLEWTHPDLRDNYNADGSWDLIDNDADPMPSNDGSSNEHGTRCAGEIAAVANDVCGVGVAFGAKIAGIKVLDGKMTDSMEANAFNQNLHINDIYSCSWGPGDDGKTLDGPHTLAHLALQRGIELGRRGFGAIYVVASGNGGARKDNCNFDGYANSIYTVTIGAVDEDGQIPYYAEECAALLAVAFSGGAPGKRSIVTTDWRGRKKGSECTTRYSGTSAAAPLAAGLIALVLQTRPCLTWRDVQYLIVLTAIKVDGENPAWWTNAAGLHHSHKHGFGLLNAWRLVNAAKVWLTVPKLTSFSSVMFTVQSTIPFHPQLLTVSFNVTSAMLSTYFLRVLEFVQVGVTVVHKQRGRLEIRLLCPSGTESLLASPRPLDNSPEGYNDWLFSSVRCWGEEAQGVWRLRVTDKAKSNSSKDGSVVGLLVSWRLILHGTWLTKSELRMRQRLVSASSSSVAGNDSSSISPCGAIVVSKTTTWTSPVSHKMLKVLLVTSVFLLAFALYQMLEHRVCYGKHRVHVEQVALLTVDAGQST